MHIASFGYLQSQNIDYVHLQQVHKVSPIDNMKNENLNIEHLKFNHFELWVGNIDYRAGSLMRTAQTS